MHVEDPLAARRVAGARRVVRAVDSHAADMREERVARQTAGLDRAALERAIHVEAGRVVRREERDADTMRPCAHGNLHVDRLELAAEAAEAGLVQSERLVPIDQRDPCAVDEHLELLAANLAERAEVAHVAEIHGIDLEVVRRVRGELVLDDETAARAERQAFDVVVLSLVARDAVHHLRRLGHLAEREAADLAGGAQIRLQQRGREA